MKSSKAADRARIARLKAAGLTVREIAEAVGVSYQRVSQVLATEPVPDWTTMQVDIEGDRLIVTSDADIRILHALVTRAGKRQGVKVETRARDTQD